MICYSLTVIVKEVNQSYGLFLRSFFIIDSELINKGGTIGAFYLLIKTLIKENKYVLDEVVEQVCFT